MKQAYLRILRHSFKTNNKNKDHMQILHSIEKGAKLLYNVYWKELIKSQTQQCFSEQQNTGVSGHPPGMNV